MWKKEGLRLQSLQDPHQCGWVIREELEETKKGLERHSEEESKQSLEKWNSFFFRKLHASHTPLNELLDETGNMHSGKEELIG